MHPAEQIEQIKKSIEKFGMDDPIGIWKDEIVEGHGRLIACKELGYTEVPIIRLDHLTDEERKAYTLAHNKLTMNSDFDIDILNDELMNFDTIDMSDFGFDLDLGMEKEQEIIEDEVPDVPEEPKAKLGDIYQLGKHRLMCGDSTKEENVEKLMNGVKADMVFTDPPYKIEIQGGFKDIIGKQLKKTMEDIAFISDFEPQNFLKVLPTVFENNKFNAYIFCNKELVLDYLLWARENKLASNILVWKKPAAFPLADNHRCDIEYLLLFRKNAIWHNSLKNVNYSRCLEYSRVNKEKENANHPTPKSVELISQEVQISSNENGIVVDLFGGSGSTLIACEQLNRKCYMMEYLPKYIDVIIQRWENFTGQKAVLLNRKENE
jgi:site-specific DNA-methyltransferase (adenine-specific)